MARLLRILRNPVGVARPRQVDQTTASGHRLEAMETRACPLCRTVTPRRRPGLGGAERRQPTWPLAAQHEPRAHHRPIQCLLHLARPSFSRGYSADLIHRTAVYGPVRTVVWEGRSREAPPYPDFHFAADAADQRRRGNRMTISCCSA